MSETLDQLYLVGDCRAQHHFDALLDCAKSTLPEFMWSDLPATRDDMGVLFNASLKSVYIEVFKNRDGYASMTAEFEVTDTEWKFKHFGVVVGTLFNRMEFNAYTVEDAAFMSRKIAQHKSTTDLESKQLIGFDKSTPRVM